MTELKGRVAGLQFAIRQRDTVDPTWPCGSHFPSAGISRNGSSRGMALPPTSGACCPGMEVLYPFPRI